MLTIDQIIGSAAMTTSRWVGRRTPLHATSAGKVFLAFMSDTELTGATPRGRRWARDAREKILLARVGS